MVLRGNRVEEFDFKSAHRKQLRGNIYLAKVTRVEPSLQAAFVDYGGNRHGFLAFSEIHPDYYQIPVADRQALIAEEERAQRAAADEIDRVPRRSRQTAASARRAEAIRSEAGEVRLDALEAESPAPPPPSASDIEQMDVEPQSGAPTDEDIASRAEMPAPESSMPEFPAGIFSARLFNGSRGRAPRPTRLRPGSRVRRPAPPLKPHRTSLPNPHPSLPRTAKARLPQKRAGLMPMARKKKPPRTSSNRSAAPTHWKRSRIARRAIADSTRSRKSSSAGKSCWCKWSRKSAAPKAPR